MKKLFIFAIAASCMLACTEQNGPSGKDKPDDTNSQNATGVLPGKFSVSTNTQVQFSQGNLQYQASTDTWRFAENQYDVIGYDNANISNTYDGWIDLFGWGTGSNPTNRNTSFEAFKNFVDWGDNYISNGGNDRKWYTMSADALKFLFVERQNAAMLFGMGRVNGVNGLIILPDNWVTPASVTFKACATQGFEYEESDRSYSYMDRELRDNFSNNIYSTKQWAIMESAGAVFLPAGGMRNGVEVHYVTEEGNYWSYSKQGGLKSFSFCFFSYDLGFYFDNLENFSYSIRLVRPASIEQNGSNGKDKPDGPNITNDTGTLPAFSVSETTKVQFSQGNLQYQASTDTWRFAENQWDFVGDETVGTVYDEHGIKCNNYLISATYSGWIDLFGWGTGDRPTQYDKSADYDSFVDWGINPITNAADGLKWRTPSAEEYEYILYERENASNLYGLCYVNNIFGLVLLPDNWSLNNVLQNNYSIDEWKNMEQQGAVFFPAGRSRIGQGPDDHGTGGYYWTATATSSSYAATLRLWIKGYVDVNDYDTKAYGRFVRLVQDVK